MDSQDRVWLAGQTTSADLPTRGALQESLGGESDGFVARMRLGEPLEFATYLGGESRDIAEGLAISPAGTVWISMRGRPENNLPEAVSPGVISVTHPWGAGNGPWFMPSDSLSLSPF